jgi:putative membrane protein
VPKTQRRETLGSFLRRWLATAIGVLAAAELIDGIHANGLVSLLFASLLLGLLNAFLRPVLMFLALPILIATLGLFTLVINAMLLMFVSTLVRGFYVAGFWPALKGSIVISIVTLLANLMLGRTVVMRAGMPPPPSSTTSAPPRDPSHRPPPDTGTGPIIDV